MPYFPFSSKRRQMALTSLLALSSSSSSSSSSNYLASAFQISKNNPIRILQSSNGNSGNGNNNNRRRLGVLDSTTPTPIDSSTIQPAMNSNNENENKAAIDSLNNIVVAAGEVIAFLHHDDNTNNSIHRDNYNAGSFAVVRVCEEDIIGTGMMPNNSKSTSSSIAMASLLADAASTSNDGVIKGEEGTTVELASALFGKPIPKPVQKAVAAKANGNGNGNGGVIADGDLTGRTVTFANKSKGLVVAHRHPIAFVLIDSSSIVNDTIATSNSSCSISTQQVSIDPLSIPKGSTVDYLGRHVAVLKDGSVSRALPKANNNINVNSNKMDLNDGYTQISLTVPTTATDNDNDNAAGIIDNNSDSLKVNNHNHHRTSSRPIFMPIPKISHIGLIDSPLLTGITAIDALTPIGKGQNMLVIGQEEEDTLVETTTTTTMGVNKRGWMINMLKFVVENERTHGSDSTKAMRCFYGLTSADRNVRSNLLKRLEKAGIQDDVVTVISTRDDDNNSENDDASSKGGGAFDANSNISTSQTLEAAEAVAVAATACTLAEHHAITTGGDALVIIDDVNLHKSLWDITTQFLVQVYGIDAVVTADLQGGSSSEMRGYFSGLIQRAARFSSQRGGGSVTLILLSTLPGERAGQDNGEEEEEETIFDSTDFDSMPEKIKARIAMLVKAKVPLTATNLKKIQLPIPRPSALENAKRLAIQHVEDLISMSDGQVWLDESLVQLNRSPPLDPSRSITRVGVGADTLTCRADAPALRQIVGSLRFDFQQALDVMESPTTGSAKQVQRRDAFLLAMHQEPSQTRKLSQECIVLLAASRGHLDQVLQKGGMAGTVEGSKAMEGLLQFVEEKAGEVVKEIDGTLDMSLEGRNALEEAISSYFAKNNKA